MTGTLILLLAGVAAVAAGELLIRVFVQWRPRGIDPHACRLAEPPDLGFEFTPDNTFCHHYPRPRVRGGPWKQCYRINALGIRDRDDIAPSPEPGSVRLVCIGDSTTFGEGVAEGQSWPRRLEHYLRSAAGPGGNKIEVINAGVAGYDLEKKLALYRERCLGLNPHAVILGYTLNDPQRLIAPRINSDGMLGSGGIPAWQGCRQLAKTHSALGSWGAHRWSELFGGPRLLPTYAERSPDWIRAREQLRAFNTLSLERGVMPLVAILPAPFRLDGHHPYQPIYRILESFLENEGIAHANLFPAIRGQRKRKMIICSCDFHYSAAAYDRFAAALNRELDSRKPFRELLRRPA